MSLVTLRSLPPSCTESCLHGSAILMFACSLKLPTKAKALEPDHMHNRCCLSMPCEAQSRRMFVRSFPSARSAITPSPKPNRGTALQVCHVIMIFNMRFLSTCTKCSMDNWWAAEGSAQLAREHSSTVWGALVRDGACNKSWREIAFARMGPASRVTP